MATELCSIITLLWHLCIVRQCFTEEAYGTESKIITMDFIGGADIYDGLEQKLAGLDIGILSECIFQL